MMADLILFDLDGVIRHFDSAVLARIEIDFGIEEGLLPTEAFQGPRFEAVIRGDMTRSTWVEEVGIAAGSTAAAHKCFTQEICSPSSTLQAQSFKPLIGVHTYQIIRP